MVMLCRNGCGVEIHFDPTKVSKNGKIIPLEYDGNPHRCPNFTYSKKKITNSSDSSNRSDPNYVAQEPCMACKYYNRKCYPNQAHNHFAKW
jgi:hypothetical protein